MDICMILGPKVGVLPSFVAKIVGNNYCTDMYLSTACHCRCVGVQYYVCVVLGSQSELCARYGDFKGIFNISSYTRLISCLNG